MGGFTFDIASLSNPFAASNVASGLPDPNNPGATIAPVAPPAITAVDTAGKGGGAWISGLGDLFGAASSSISNILKVIDPPKPGQLVYDPRSAQYVPAGVPTAVQPGQAVYNPVTGTYQQVPGFGQNSTMIFLLIAGVLVVFLMKR